MDAQTFYDLNTVYAKLVASIRLHRFDTGRGGMIPPEALADAERDLSDALAMIRALQNGSVTTR